MTDNELKKLLKSIDNKFIAIIPLLEKAGKAFEEKAKEEAGVDLKYRIGWTEDGMDCLSLEGVEDGMSFSTYSEAEDWEEFRVKPLFEGLRRLHYYAPYSLYGG